MKVIFNADDFGLAYSFTEGVRKCFTQGVVRSTSIRTNGPAFEYATSLLKDELKNIGLGLHLNLTDGCGSISDLTNESGYYKYDFFKLWLMLLKPEKRFLSAITKDLESQFQKVLEAGLKPDHVDSEKHVHIIPPIFEITSRLCRKYQIDYVRLVREPYFLTGSIKNNLYPWSNLNIVKFLTLDSLSKIDYAILNKYNLKTSDAYYGVLYTNNMNLEVLKKIILNAFKKSFEVIEISSHPAFPKDKRDKVYTSFEISLYANQKNRLAEAKTLMHDNLLKFLKSKNVNIISYKDLI